MPEYEFKLPPFSHQLEEFNTNKDQPYWALFWEQGTGKSKETIDQACYNFEQGRINAIFVLAPNGVHRNWITDEIVAHIPDRIMKQTLAHFYQAPKAKTKWHQADVNRVLNHDGLAVLAMSYDAFMTKEGKKVAWEFLKSKKVFYTTDEADAFKNPNAKRTKSVVASGRYAIMKRLLTGTPVNQGPFDVYSLMKFLKEDFWKPYGLSSFYAFKQHFGVWEKKYNSKLEREYDQLISYKNLDQLYEILQSASSRVLKEDVLDLPPKLYSKRYFELSREQQRVYDELKNEFMTFLDSGEFIAAPLAITRLLRLQQITSNYVPAEDGEGMHLISDKNPRIDCLRELIEVTPHKTIIWARFRQDIDQIMELLTAMGRKPVRYDGQVDDVQRGKNKEAFQDGDATDFVGNPAAGATGLTLHAARTVIYYNNSFKLRDRLQSEDRAHRIGQEHPVNYVDIVAPDTVDENIVHALRNKLDIASQITGDELKEWI